MAKSRSFASVLLEFQATTAKMQKSITEASTGLKKLGKDIDAVKKIAEASFAFQAVKVAINTVKGLTGAVRELVREGDRAGDIAGAFKALGGNASSIDRARGSILGLVDSYELMAVANKGFVRGIGGFNESFVKISTLAGRLAQALGHDVKDEVESLTNAIVAGKAKGLIPLQFHFTQTKDKALVTKEALAQLDERIKALPEVTDSAGDAFDSLDTSIGQIQKTVGSYLADNETLRKSIRDLEAVLVSIDFKQVADNLGTLVASFIDLGATALPPVVKALQTVSMIFTSWENRTTQQKYDSVAAQISDLQEQMSLGIVGPEAQKEVDGLMAAMRVLHKELYGTTEEAVKPARKEFDALGNAAGNAAKEIEKAQAKIAEQKQGLLLQGLNREMEQSLLNKEWDKYRQLEDEVAMHIYKGVVDGYKDATGAVPAEIKGEVEALAAWMANEEIRVREDKLIESQKNLADKQKEEMNRAFQESVDFFADVFTQALNGGFRDLDNFLKQIAVNFAAEIAGSLTGFSIKGGLPGIGNALAQMVLGGNSGMGGMLGTAAGAAVGGGLGIAMAGGGTYVGGMIAGMGGTVGPVASGAAYSGMMMGSTIAAAMPYIAAAAGAYMLAENFGLFDNKRHPETQARRDVVGWMEERLGRNVVLGPDSRFNTEAGYASLTGLGGREQTAFSGVGEALTNLLGVTEDVGSQIAAVLADDVGGSLDKLKVLIRELGVSEQEMIDSLIASSLKAGKNLLELQVQINGVRDAFAPGLSGFADLAGAVQSFVDSGNAGFAALQGLVNIAVEGGEAGATTIEQLGEKLQGILAPDQLQIMLQALADLGISTMEQLASATQETLIALAAHLEALGFSFNKVAEGANNATNAIEGTGAAAYPGNAGAIGHAKGGVVSSPTYFRFGGKLGLMGEAGAEAILPLTRINGVLGVRAAGGSSGSIYIDARGASPGVEHQILAAMEAAKEGAIREALSAVRDAKIRNPNYGGAFYE